MTDPYHSEYDGCYVMKDHDREENALERWFNNYKIDRLGYFCSEYEFCIVEEVEKKTRRGGKQYLVTIDGGPLKKRIYKIEPTAPEPPVLTFAAKKKYVPPPPKTAYELAQEREWLRQQDRFYHEMMMMRRSLFPADYLPPPPPPKQHRRNV